MMLTADVIAKVKEMANDPYREYEYIGVRVQEQEFELGEMDHVSHVWDNGDDTGEELNGVCALKADALELAEMYFGEHAAIIAGNSIEYGEDVGEIIISDAVVIEILA